MDLCAPTWRHNIPSEENMTIVRHTALARVLVARKCMQKSTERATMERNTKGEISTNGKFRCLAALAVLIGTGAATAADSGAFVVWPGSEHYYDSTFGEPPCFGCNPYDWRFTHKGYEIIESVSVNITPTCVTNILQVYGSPSGYLCVWQCNGGAPNSGSYPMSSAPPPAGNGTCTCPAICGAP